MARAHRRYHAVALQGRLSADGPWNYRNSPHGDPEKTMAAPPDKSCSCARIVHAQGRIGQDRAEIIRQGNVTLVVVTDGAGGRTGGTEAAESVINSVIEDFPTAQKVEGGQFASEKLSEIDRLLHRAPDCGEAAAIVLATTEGRISGAVVGDCEARLIDREGQLPLAPPQRRAPFLGTGKTVPLPFAADSPEGRLIVGTDGLFRYVRDDSFREAASATTPRQACKALVSLVELPSGNLRDDVAVVVCELDSQEGHR